MTETLQHAPDPAFSFAFQPIVDADAHEAAAWEALIRGTWDEPAWHVLNQIPSPRLPLFDRNARAAAVALAARLGIRGALHLNLLSQSLISDPKTLASTFEAAQRAGVALDRLVLETPEADILEGRTPFLAQMKDARERGVKLAIDNFGSAYASLNLLLELDPHQVKLDMRLIRGIERQSPRQAIVRSIIELCAGLGIDLIAAGVETVGEYSWLRDQNIRFFQGYLFARPGFEALPPAQFPLTTLADLSARPVGSSRPASAARTKKRA